MTPVRLLPLLACGLCLGCGQDEEASPPSGHQGPLVVALAAADHHTCALFEDGGVKCWGGAEHGLLGSGDVNNRGDEPGEMGAALPWVDLGSERHAVAIAAGGGHSCALLDDATMKCWGSAYAGRNGSGDEYDNRGDEPGEMGDALAPLDLGMGRTIKAVSTGYAHSCALLDDGSDKCWGHGAFGQLGQGDIEHLGDNPGELGDALLPIDLGAGKSALGVVAAADHSCALLDDASVKCWGAAFSGRLGTGNTEENLGDDPGEMGDALPAIELGASALVRSLATGSGHTCVLLDDGGVKCWGGNPRGQLGLGDTNDRGDEPGEMAEALPQIDLGDAEPIAVSAGGNHTCVLLEDGRVKCFGASLFGVLGNGAVTEIGEVVTPTAHLGDEPLEMGEALPAVDLGVRKTALAISAGTRHTCALLDDHSVKCWGDNSDGQLGLGDTETRGDQPGEMGDALPALDL